MISLSAVYFYGCALLAIAGSLGVVVSKNPTRGALGLLLAIISIAGLFLPLHAEFLAAIQLIVYAGAIVVLLLFVIMMLGPDAAPASDRREIVVRVLAALSSFSGGGGARDGWTHVDGGASLSANPNTPARFWRNRQLRYDLVC